MTYLSRSVVLFVVVVLVTALVPIFGCPSPGQGQDNLTDRVMAVEAALVTTQTDLATTQTDLASTQVQLATAQAKLAHVSVQQGILNGVNGPHMIIEGCNVHLRSNWATSSRKLRVGMP